MEEKKYWVWLSGIRNVGPVTIEKLLSFYDSPEEIFHASEEELRSIQGLSYQRINFLKEAQNEEALDQAANVVKSCEAQGIRILCSCDDDFPERMRAASKMPVVMYCKGSIEEWQNTLGIVGASRCSRAERQQAIDEVLNCVSEGYTLVSGMGKGIDAYSHILSMDEGVGTVAVLANGLDIYNPAEHMELQNHIAENGLLLSEYPPGTKPGRYRGTHQNRVIAALADKLLVVGDGYNRAVADMIKAAEEYEKEVVLI